MEKLDIFNLNFLKNIYNVKRILCYFFLFLFRTLDNFHCETNSEIGFVAKLLRISLLFFIIEFNNLT